MKNLRGLRVARKMTMKSLGDVIGVAESTISLYETGKREPDIATLARLSDYFGVPVDFIIGENGVNWEHQDMYEDYWHCSATDKVRFVEHSGIDFSIAADYYETITQLSQSPKDFPMGSTHKPLLANEAITPAQWELLYCYECASADDREAVDIILRKYKANPDIAAQAG